MTDSDTQNAPSEGDIQFAPSVVLPGEDLKPRIAPISNDVKVGRGIDSRIDGKSISATKSGILRFRPKNKFWVESNQKRYIPVVDDVVIGVIVSRHAENYKVDVGTSSNVQLDALAFDGASKRNKPNLQVGDIVYARVILANRDIEPEISCAVSERSAKKMDWVTGQSTYGQLHGGYLFRCSLGLCRRLRSTASPNVLDVLGQHLAYEVVLGSNGRVWVNSNSPAETILVSNAILNSEHLPHKQVIVMVNELVRAHRLQAE